MDQSHGRFSNRKPSDPCTILPSRRMRDSPRYDIPIGISLKLLEFRLDFSRIPDMLARLLECADTDCPI